MNFDQLHEQWRNEEVSTPEISLENQKKIHNPLEKIRKNMRMEFWSSVFIIVFLLIFLYIKIDIPKLRIYVLTLVSVMVFVSAFYFKKFFMLYKDLLNNSLNTMDTLKDLMHQFELNKQYYLGYCLAFVPFLVCEVILIYEFSNRIGITYNDFFGISFILFVLLTLFLLYAVGTWWFERYYGKYIKQIDKIIKELK